MTTPTIPVEMTAEEIKAQRQPLYDLLGAK
jgi:hypothetical protein